MSQSPSSGRLSLSDHFKGWLQIALVVGVLALGVIINQVLSAASSPPRQSVSGDDAILVEVIQPRPVSTPLIIRESGAARSRNTVGLTPQVGGQVVEVSINLASGQLFEAGEVLFRVDPSDYQAELDRANADLSAAQADLRVEMAEADVARNEWELVNPGEPVPDLVARGPQIDRAEAAVESAAARQRTAQLNLSRVAVSLPFSGRVVSTTVELGQTLSPNQTYGQAYALGSLEVSVPINANALTRLEPAVGRPAILRIEGGRSMREYPAEITRVEAELDAQTRLAGLIIQPVGQTDILPGTFLEVEITGPVIERALPIPEQAISDNLDVWVVQNGRLARRSITPLGLNEDGALLVAQFAYGEGVVISPLVSPTETTPARIVEGGGEL
ncbi:efflux RND transporter periplasmic adaptor subunit [Maricaulaceae bacterium MS644]